MDIQKNTAATNKSVVFKFKQLCLTIFWLCAMNVFLMYAYIRRIHQEKETFGDTVALVIILTIVWLIGILVLSAQSDVVIDKQKISRRLFGLTWQRIRWDNIDRIVVFPITKGTSYYVLRGFNIYPKIKPSIKLLPAGKMAITENINDASNFINLLNNFIIEYKIRVEKKDSLHGESTLVSHI
jgi:hypothetical protein